MLYAALAKSHPDVAARLKRLVLYNTRAPRPGERDGVDYHFRPRDYIEGLRRREDFMVMDVRHDLHALDIDDLHSAMPDRDVFFEGNPFVARALQTCELPSGSKRLSIFLAPLSKEEIVYLKAPERGVCLPDFVADVLRRKLIRRTQRHKGGLSLRDLEEVERRAVSAYGELKEAQHFQHVIPNHDGEDSENWDAFYYPVGDARRTLLAVAELLEGRTPPIAEVWEDDLLP